MTDALWTNAVNAINRAGQIPIPATDTFIELLQTILTPAQAEFITIFNKPLNMDEVVEKTGESPAELQPKLGELMHAGVITGLPSRKTGVVVYRLLPAFPGIFEFTLMRGGTSEKDKKLARLFDTMFQEMSDLVQGNYDAIVPAMKHLPPTDRVIPVESQIDAGQENVLPADEVRKIIDKFDTIAVATCYCRHEKDLLGEPCQVTDKRENCLVFGPGAQFTIDQKFARPISKEEALEILQESEDAGLVHKSFHTKLDPAKEQEAICSCCKCCCGTFQLHYRGVRAMHSVTAYQAEVDAEACIGCGVCVDMCPMEAIALVDEIAQIEVGKCLGCGICAHHCEVDAARLINTGQREVFVPPPKLTP